MLFDVGMFAYSACLDCINNNTVPTYTRSIKADQAWNLVNRVQGQNIAVAVVDSGIVAAAISMKALKTHALSPASTSRAIVAPLMTAMVTAAISPALSAAMVRARPSVTVALPRRPSSSTCV